MQTTTAQNNRANTRIWYFIPLSSSSLYQFYRPNSLHLCHCRMSLSSSACPSVGKDAATSNSSIVSGLSKRKGTDTQGKLDAINQQLAEVRKKLADRHSSQQLKHHKPKEKQTIQSKRKSTKKTFHHPKLDFVLGEVVFSPYMTKPLDPYPQETFEVPKRLHELKKKVVKGSELSKDELPYDVDFVRNRFIHEVANFSVSFNMSPVGVFRLFACLDQ